MQKPGLKNVDLKMAAFWYLKAAEQNERNSAFQIANMYFSGEGGLPKDIDKAYYWMEKAAEQDNAYAQRALVEMYSKGKGDKQIDYYLAYIWLRVLAEGDHYWSMEDDELHWKLNEEVKQKQLLEFKKNLSSTQLTLAENKIDELKKIAEKNIHEQNRAEAAYECSIDKLSPEENQKCIEKIYSGMLESEKINKQLWGI